MPPYRSRTDALLDQIEVAVEAKEAAFASLERARRALRRARRKARRSVRPLLQSRTVESWRIGAPPAVSPEGLERAAAKAAKRGRALLEAQREFFRTLAQAVKARVVVLRLKRRLRAAQPL